MKDTLEDYQGLLGIDVRPMEEEEMKNLFIMMQIVGEHPDKIDEVFEENTAQMAGQIAVKRLAYHATQYDKALLVFVLTLCESPGLVVLWCYTLHLMAAELGRAATINDFCTQFFPMGVPTEKALEAAWDAQKGTECDNRLDSCDWSWKAVSK